MRIIDREWKPLDRPDNEGLQSTYATLKQIHSDAYSWSPSDIPTMTATLTRPMRSYVRRWINQWDLERLYPGEQLDTVETELKTDYSESPELQQASESLGEYSVAEE